MNHFRSAQDLRRERLSARPGAFFDQDVLAPPLMRLGGLPDDLDKGRPVHVQIVFARASHGAQNISAAVSLIADQDRIIAQIGIGLELLGQFRGGEFYCGQGRAELMGGGCDHPA